MDHAGWPGPFPLLRDSLARPAVRSTTCPQALPTECPSSMGSGTFLALRRQEGRAAPPLDAFLATGRPRPSMALQMSVRRSVRGWRALTDGMESSRNPTLKLRLAISRRLLPRPAAQLGIIRMSTTLRPAVLVLTHHQGIRARPNAPPPNLARLRADKSR